MAWPIVVWNGVNYYQAQGNFLVPVDPSTGSAIIMLREDGGVGDGFSAIEKGDPGVPANVSNTIDFTELAWDDPTAASASFVTLTPPTTSTPGLFQLVLRLHAGQKGADGDTILTPSDFGSPVAKQMLQVKADLSGFELIAQRIPELFFPGSVSNTSSGNANSTLAAVNIPSRPWARRIVGHGGTVVAGEGADVRVDMLARLNGESGGNIVGRCPGIAQNERLTLWPGKDAGLADTYDQVNANATGTVHFRCERQAGTTTFTTSASTTRVYAEALPL